MKFVTTDFCFYQLYCLLIVLASGESVLNSKLCEHLPSEDEIESMSKFSYWAPECIKSGSNNPSGCPSMEEEIDWSNELSVLVEPIKCFYQACASSNIDESLQLCSQNLLSQFRNVFQLRPDDFESQVMKACKCNYSSVTSLHRQTDLGVISIDDFVHAYNCEKNSKERNKVCVNPIVYLEEQKVCLASPEEFKEKLYAFREILELYKFKSMCDDSFLQLMRNSDAFQFLPRLPLPLQKDELFMEACDNECFYPLEYFDMFKPNPYHYVEEEIWNEKCKNFTWLKGRTFYSGTVHFQEIKGVWLTVHEQCGQFRRIEGQYLEEQMMLPDMFNWVPFPGELVKENDVYEALNICCKDSEYYQQFSQERDSDRHIAGVFEVFCLVPKKVILGFTFIDWMIRGLVHRYSVPENAVHNLPDESDQEREHRSTRPQGADQLRLLFNYGENGERKLSPSDVFWFLRYIRDRTAKRCALRACIEGSKFGRTVTILPGLVMSVEAQRYAVTAEDLPDEHRLLSMMAYHTCAVFASGHANNCFDHDSNCNEFALDSFHAEAKRETEHSEL